MRLIILALLLSGSVASWGMTFAQGASPESDCPGGGTRKAGCLCWKEAEVLKMACPGEPTAGHNLPTAAANPVSDLQATAEERWLTEDELRSKLTRRHETLDHDLLTVQRARFEAKARGADADVLSGLGQRFTHIQAQRRHVIKRLRSLDTDR